MFVQLFGNIFVALCAGLLWSSYALQGDTTDALFLSM